MWRPGVSLVILTLVALLHYVDRLILAMLIEPIRVEFSLTDTQIGLLTGAAFALLYATAAIPIARAAEHYNRIHILGLSTIVWSAATVACGWAGGFVSLLISRVFVGLGEAGAIAPSMSVISDLFSRRARGRAMSVYGLGGALGVAAAPLIGAALLPSLGWRGTLVCVGAIGLPIALLLLLAVREPQRGQADAGTRVEAPAPLGAALFSLFARPSFALAVPAFVFLALAQQSMLLWMPAYFQRSFGADATTLGAQLALFQGVPIVLGTLVGGFVTDPLSRQDQRWTVWAPMAGALLAVPAMVALVSAPNLSTAMIALSVPSFVQGFCIGPCYALVQNLAPTSARATASAVMAFCISLIGIGLGPLLLGLISHHMSAQFHNESLRYALSSTIPMFVLAALVFGLISLSVQRDLAQSNSTNVGG